MKPIVVVSKPPKIGIHNEETYNGSFKTAGIGIWNEEVYSDGFITAKIGYLQNQKKNWKF